MLTYIHNLVLSTKNHQIRSKTSEILKISTYVPFFFVLSIISSGTSLAKTVCSTEVIKEEGFPTLSAEMLNAMHGAISTNTFVLDEPYTLISQRKFCTGESESKIGSGNSVGTFDSTPNPDPTPEEGDTQSVTQTRDGGTWTWTYTFIDGIWVLTEYKYIPTTNEEP